MTRDEVLAIYSAGYAARYDEKFLESEHYREASAFELQWLREHIRPGTRWLDVACGTGWYLRRFPEVERCGLDLSPGMLDRARRCNPDARFIEGDYRDSHDELRGSWDLVTLMWWAYVYAGSLAAIDRLIANLGAWTATGGTCFAEICDPAELCQLPLPNQLGATEVTAVLWKWTDDRCGTCHDNLIAPHLDYLLRAFRRSFDDVEVIDYPRFQADAVGGTRRAIVARKRSL